MDNALLFLLKLAWESRFKLPLLITIGFMMLDIRMQLEVTVESRRVRRIRPIPGIPENQGNPGPSGRRADEDNGSDSNNNKRVFAIANLVIIVLQILRTHRG